MMRSVALSGVLLLVFSTSWSDVPAAEEKPAESKAAAGPELVLQTGHSGDIKFTLLSPDGRTIATGSEDKTVILWDADTGQQIHTLRGHRSTPECGAFRPDGRELVTVGGHDDGAVVWDVESGQRIRSFKLEWSCSAQIAFTPDGKQWITNDWTKICVWDADTGKQLQTITPKSGKIQQMAVSPDGRLVMARLDHKSDPCAVIWDVETGKLVVEFPGMEGTADKKPWLGYVAFSPDGKQVTHSWVDIGSNEIGVIVWDLASLRQVCTFRENKKPFLRGTPDATAFSPDGRTAATVIDKYDRDVILWDPRTGATKGDFRDLGGSGCALSPDGRRIFEFEDDRTVAIDVATGKWLYSIPESGTATLTGDRLVTVVWRQNTFGNDYFDIVVREIESGRELSRQPIQMPTVTMIARLVLSDDGRFLARGELGNISVWSTSDGRLVSRFKDDTGIELAFSPDGHQLLAGGMNTVTLWDVATGQKIRSFGGFQGNQTMGFTLSPDGKKVFATAWQGGVQKPDCQAILWDAHTGAILHNLRWNNAGNGGGWARFTPDSRKLLIWGPSEHLSVWDAEKGTLLRHLACHGGRVSFSDDGRYLLSGHKPAIVWDFDRTIPVRACHPYGAIKTLCFSPDGQRCLTAGEKSENMGIVWDVESGVQVMSLRNRVGPVGGVAFSPDGRRLATAVAGHGGIRSIVIWDLTSGRPAVTFGGLSGTGWPARRRPVFSRDGNRIAVPDQIRGIAGLVAVQHHAETGLETGLFPIDDNEKTTIDAETICFKTENLDDSRRKFPGHTAGVTCVAHSPDGKRIATSSEDGTTRIWDAEKGTELVRLISIDGGLDWAVTTPEGLFDGSPGSRQLTMFRVPGQNRPVPIDRFFKDFYRPSLLAAAFSGQRELPEVKLGQSLPPLVKILSPRSGDVESDHVAIEAEATDQGGGVSDLCIFQNGSRVLAAGDKSIDGKTIRRTFKVSLIEGENRLRVQAASGDRSWEAEPAEITLRYEKPLDKSEMYLLTVGINRYADAGLNLQFAAKDAQAMGDLFARRGKALYQEVHVTQLLDDQATREKIKDSLAEIGRQSKAQDTLVVFMAGHGLMVGQRYYFIPHELRRKADTLEEDIRKQGLPGDELSEWIAGARAIRRIQIYDTCASGGALALNRQGRSGFALRGAIERLSRAQGIFTIAAASAGEEAQESKELGHGVLSYALLAGMKGVDRGPLEDQWVQPSNSDQVVDVLEWFSFAASQVPRLTEKLFGAAQDVPMSAQGKSFPVLPLAR